MEIGGGKLTLDRGFLFNMVFIIGKLVAGDGNLQGAY